MIRVFQDKTIHNDGVENSFNAAVASILELPLRKTCRAVSSDPGSWIDQWREWLADRGYKLIIRRAEDPPRGYSVAMVYTERKYPEAFKSKAGAFITHACVAFDGTIVHDPYPFPSQSHEIKYYSELRSMSEQEKQKHLLTKTPVL